MWHQVARGCTATFTRPLWVPHFTDISSAPPPLLYRSNASPEILVTTGNIWTCVSSLERHMPTATHQIHWVWLCQCQWCTGASWIHSLNGDGIWSRILFTWALTLVNGVRIILVHAEDLECHHGTIAILQFGDFVGNVRWNANPAACAFNIFIRKKKLSYLSWMPSKMLSCHFMQKFSRSTCINQRMSDL